MKKSVRFIVNPISGTRGKEAIIRLIPQYLSDERFRYEIVYTERSGHAAQLAQEAAEAGVDIVVAVGGDGTVNEVARSLVHTQTALAIVPCGSGNGLARHLFIPINPIGALKILAECQIETLDYGKINDQPFFCTCGIGFDAFISERFAHAGKRGLMTYVDNTLKGGLTYKPETYRVSIDGQEQEYEAFLIACANASQYGNNVYIAPAASMNDGLMDVTILEPFPLLEAPQVVMQLLNKTIDRIPTRAPSSADRWASTARRPAWCTSTATPCSVARTSTSASSPRAYASSSTTRNSATQDLSSQPSPTSTTRWCRRWSPCARTSSSRVSASNASTPNYSIN